MGDADSWWKERPGPGVCDLPCKFTQTVSSAFDQLRGCSLFDLPEQCVVYWSRWRGEIRATSTTTFMANSTTSHTQSDIDAYEYAFPYSWVTSSRSESTSLEIIR
jgi:hypothetical protein